MYYILLILSISLNFIKIPLFYGVDILFGSIIVFYILQHYSLTKTLIAAFLTALVTYYHWQHFYSVITFFCEALFVGLLFKRYKNIVITNLLFWLFFGAAFVFIFYHFFLNVSGAALIIVILKQSINGVFNALIAFFAYRILRPLIFLKKENIKIKLQDVLFGILILFIMLPVLFLIINSSHYNLKYLENEFKIKLEHTIDVYIKSLEHLLETQENIPAIDDLLNQKLQKNLEITKKNNVNILIIDNQRNIIFSTNNKFNQSLKFDDFKDYEHILIADNFKKIFPVAKNLSPIRRWNESKYIMLKNIEINNWRICAFIEAGPYQHWLFNEIKYTIIIISILTILAITISYITTNSFLYDLNHFNLMTENIIERVNNDQKIDWINPKFSEFQELNNRFKNMYDKLGEYIAILKETQNKLEQRVADRTQELAEINKKLQTEIFEKNKLIDTLKLHDSAIAASNESIIITDALDDNKIIFVNNAFERISGYTKEEALGRNPRFLHNTNADKTAIEKLRTAIKNKEAVSTELLNCKKDGQEYWIFLSIAPIKNQEGIVTNFVGITQDISYHKKIERHLKHAKEQAEQANKIKSQFLANISHELRTPLNAILNIAHFLETTELTEKQKEYLQVLRNSSNNLFYLINQILDIQILESQELQLNFIAFDFVEFINSVKTHINEVVTKKNLDFIVALDQNIPKILIGDQNRIRQILLNILFNAIKFTDDGYIKLEIKLLSKTNDSCEILFVIADTGIGINDENKKIIFDNFMQVDNSNIRRYGGIGIGLSISKKLITLMNGNISVEDNNPKGTVFKFNITLKLDEKIQDLKIEKMLFDLKDNYKILVAEDDKTNQFIIKNLFNDLNNFSVDIVENGKDAVEYYKTNKYNLILMDIQMPEMDGLTALEYIRNFEKQNNLVAAPAFILSATAIEQFKDKIEKLNITGYIAKPIYPRSFYNQIAKILKIKNSLHPQKSEKTIETNNIVPEKIEENNLSRLLKLSNETIDINKALANIDNEVDLYFILANQYYSDYGSKIAEIKTIFENNQYDKMIFFSHKLVTAAANIGAYKLSKMSKQIENILNDKQELSAELYVAYISELEKVNEMLKEIKQIG